MISQPFGGEDWLENVFIMGAKSSQHNDDSLSSFLRV